MKLIFQTFIFASLYYTHNVALISHRFLIIKAKRVITWCLGTIYLQYVRSTYIHQISREKKKKKKGDDEQIIF